MQRAVSCLYPCPWAAPSPQAQFPTTTWHYKLVDKFWSLNALELDQHYRQGQSAPIELQLCILQLWTAHWWRHVVYSTCEYWIHIILSLSFATEQYSPTVYITSSMQWLLLPISGLRLLWGLSSSCTAVEWTWLLFSPITELIPT